MAFQPVARKGAQVKLATKAQLDRAVRANREAERLRAVLESPDFMTPEEWAAAAEGYCEAKAEAVRANRVLASIEAFNRREP